LKEIEFDFKPKRKNFKIEELGDDFILYDEFKDEIFLLNKSAKIVFDMCDGNFTFKEIVDIISDNLKTPKEIILKDVKKILNEFIKKGIIEKG
jgi:hypothetical protein